MKLSEIFRLSWKKLWIVIVGGFLSIILHNAIYGLFGVEEAFFFIIVVFIIPLYIIISVPTTLINIIKKNKKK